MSNLYGKRSSGKLWGASSSQTYGEINLRSEINEILFGSTSRPQRGHWIILRRYDLTTRSDNFDEVMNEGVGGPGYEYADELVMSRRDPMFGPESAEKYTDPGHLVQGRYVYYFEHDVNPNPHDQLFEIEWTDHRVQPTLSQVPTPYQEKFNIKEVFPHRADSGRIEYWTCIVNSDKINY